MERVRKSELEWCVSRIALYLERPERAYSVNDTVDTDGTIRPRVTANVGALKLDYAACYGGYSLVEMSNEAGGERTLSGSRKNAREMMAFLRGMMLIIDSFPNVYVVKNAAEAGMLQEALA